MSTKEILIGKCFAKCKNKEIEVCKPKNKGMRRDEPSQNKISQKAHETGRKRLVSSNFFVFRQFLQVGNPSFVEFRDEISWLAHHNKEIKKIRISLRIE